MTAPAPAQESTPEPPAQTAPSRRTVLKYGLGALATVAVGNSVVLGTGAARRRRRRQRRAVRQPGRAPP